MVTLAPLLVITVVVLIVALYRQRAKVARLQRTATTDTTTGLLNTLGWHELARAAVTCPGHDQRTGTGVLMVDLDHFKQVNDTFGHLAGNAVLAAVGAALTRSVRDRDRVGRLGGDEFAVLLSAVTTAELGRVAERIRATIPSLHVDHDLGGDGLAITGLSVSIGAALCTDGGGMSVEQLLQAADHALYTAKRSGRNTVCHELVSTGPAR